MTTKPSKFKVGPISGEPIGADGWRLRYQDPATGRDVRRKLAGLGLREVQAVAANIQRELLVGGGYIPGAKAKPVVPSLAEGLAAAIEARNTSPAVTRNRSQKAALFVKWMAEQHPRVVTWDQVRPAMVQSFANHLDRLGRSPDTIILALAPVKLAWNHVRHNYPEALPVLPRIKVKPAPRRELQCLEADEAAALLDWLKARDAGHYAMAALAALAGLRVLEVAALRAEDVNLAAGTVSIRSTAHHAVKTRDSERTIPVCGEVREALAAALEARKVIPPTGEIFPDRQGNPRKLDPLVHLWRRNLLAAAKAIGVSRLAEVPIHRLRSAFVTMAGRLGAPDRLLKKYVGHTAGDVLGGHYRRIDLAELRTVSTLMDGWRNPVVQGRSEGESGIILASGETPDSQSVEFTGVCEG